MTREQVAIRKLIEAMAEVCDVVFELDPGKTATINRIQDLLSDAREALKQARHSSHISAEAK